MPEETADEPDAHACKCGKAYSYSHFNCACGLMDCGHGWRTGGETRNTCDRCYGEAGDAIDAFKAGLLELTQSLVHLGLEPRPDGRSIGDGKRPWYQHVSMVLSSLKAENFALRKALEPVSQGMFLDHDHCKPSELCSVCLATEALSS